MKEPTKEQIRKFWEWIGWEFSPDGLYYRVNSNASGWGYVSQLPPTDLNNIFRYAVPKLLNWELSKSPSGYYVEIDTKASMMSNTRYSFRLAGDDPALVFLQVILDAIEFESTSPPLGERR